MIRKLRRKFILINMTLVCTVLLIVFSAISLSAYHKQQEEGHSTLQRAVSQGVDMPPPKLEVGGYPGQKPQPLMPVFSVLLDREGDILFSEQKNVTVSDEILQQAVEEVQKSDQAEGILSGLGLRYLRQDDKYGTKIAFVDRTNEIASMKSLILNLLLAGAGGIVAFYFISLFLSGWALRPVERALKQQRQFTADASHELKTPLTSILANMGILLENREDTVKGQMKWVENTKTEAVRMKKLVDDLLYLAKSDEARLPAVFSRLDLSDLVISCILPFEAVAYEHGVTINSSVEPGIGTDGDEGQLKQLVTILLDNACKYAGEKGTVTVELVREQDRARMTVVNTGATIPPEDIGHIFERFYRIDRSRAREQGGFGLGLSIAKSIADNHRAKISVTSDDVNGTAFSIILHRTPE